MARVRASNCGSRPTGCSPCATVDGRLVAGHVRGSSRVGALVTTIVWRPDGAWRSRAILLVPDALPEDDFRRLRVLLRYARNGPAQSRPHRQSTAL